MVSIQIFNLDPIFLTRIGNRQEAKKTDHNRNASTHSTRPVSIFLEKAVSLLVNGPNGPALETQNMKSIFCGHFKPIFI
jgi:hypothetical protein